jgi:F plasmid transfer operon protein TraF
VKKVGVLLLAALGVMGGTAFGAEFQPVGNALGIGGAGVARTFDAYAPYWNPAGLAFHDRTFSTRLHAGAGIRINSSMAENVDRLGTLNVDNLANLDINTATLTPAQISANLANAGTAAQFVGILNDLQTNQGTLTATADAVLGFQYRNFGIGGYTTAELAALPSIETVNIRPGGTTTLVDYGQGIGALDPVTGAPLAVPTGTFFSPTQRAAISTAFGGGARGDAIADRLAAQFASPTGNASTLSPAQLAVALVAMGNSFAGTGASLDLNESTLEYKGLIVIDFPISYGHQFDLGPFGKLGLGGSLKVMQGRAFIGESQIVTLKDSGDIIKNVTDHHQDSTTFGIDLGALWQYDEWLRIGVVAKNLNSPDFDSPTVNLPIRGLVQEEFIVRPQVRAGVAIDPLSWLTIAADCDLTSNRTILFDHKNQTLGGGVELHPVSWFKVRGGMYKNLAEGEIGPVATAGLTFGPAWLNMDLDGAAALDNAKYKDSTYPREARLQLSINALF